MKTLTTPDETEAPAPDLTALHQCPNCGEQAMKKFCPECGQETAQRIIPLRHLTREFVSEVFSFDTRLFQSLRLMLGRPGFLAAEYVAGRRARYLSPLRMYLILSALAVWLSSRVGDTGLATSFNLFLCLVPLLALTLAVLFHRSKRLYMEHLIFALYFHGFTALLTLLMYLVVVPLARLHLFPMSGAAHQLARRVTITVWFVAEYGHLALGLRRFYRAPVWAVLGTLPIIVVMYVFTLLAGVWLLHQCGVKWQ